jgi:hypothetical protein
MTQSGHKFPSLANRHTTPALIRFRLILRGIRTCGNNLQIEFMYQCIRCRETIPLPPTKIAIKDAYPKLAAIFYTIKTVGKQHQIDRLQRVNFDALPCCSPLGLA